MFNILLALIIASSNIMGQASQAPEPGQNPAFLNTGSGVFKILKSGHMRLSKLSSTTSIGDGFEMSYAGKIPFVMCFASVQSLVALNNDGYVDYRQCPDLLLESSGVVSRFISARGQILSDKTISIDFSVETPNYVGNAEYALQRDVDFAYYVLQDSAN